jgi:GAF domain-containing protein
MPMVQLSPELERERLNVLRAYQILDTPPDGAFDHVTQLAAQFYGVPISLISLVDHDRIWFKSRYGLDGVEQIDRVPGLCGSSTFADGAYVVRDALTDPRTLDNPLVRGEFGLRFYAAAPLITHDGYRLGNINIIDFQPRDLTIEQELALHLFARIVMDQMELRLAARETICSLQQMMKRVLHTGDVSDFVTICAWSRKIKIDNQWLTFEEFLQRFLGLKVTHGIEPTLAQAILEATNSEADATR